MFQMATTRRRAGNTRDKPVQPRREATSYKFFVDMARGLIRGGKTRRQAEPIIQKEIEEANITIDSETFKSLMDEAQAPAPAPASTSTKIDPLKNVDLEKLRKSMTSQLIAAAKKKARAHMEQEGNMQEDFLVGFLMKQYKKNKMNKRQATLIAREVLKDVKGKGKAKDEPKSKNKAKGTSRQTRYGRQPGSIRINENQSASVGDESSDESSGIPARREDPGAGPSSRRSPSWMVI